MTQDMFPIDGRGRTFNAEGAEVKLSPAMQSLVRALNAHGYIDPIRDFGRRTGTSTVVGLIDRGILREARSHRGVHFPATTPAQVWDEAHDEDARRDAERAAHADDPESWVQTVDDSDADEVHIRMRRDGSQVRILSVGFRYWRVYFPGQSTSMSAGGTWQEARAAADRYERNEAHDAAIDEDDARSIAQGRESLGWGQPDGMLSAPDAPAWTPVVGDTVLYGRGTGITMRPFGRVLLVDGTKVKVAWPGGIDWHAAHDLEYYLMPSDTPVRAELEAQSAAYERGHTAAANAAQPLIVEAFKRGKAMQAAMPEVHAFSRDLFAAVSAAACGEPGTVRGPADLVTCPACRELLARRAQTPAEAEASIAALAPADALLQADLRTGRADRKALPIVPENPPRRCGRGETHLGHDWPDIYKGGVFTCHGLPGTPAEARTGVSDRAAAALADVALMQRLAEEQGGVRHIEAMARIEATLRGGR